MSFFVQDFTFYPSSSSGGSANYPQSGTVTGVLADGSALSTVTFSVAYTATPFIGLQVTTSTSTGVAYVPTPINPSNTGFEIQVVGGTLGSTVTVDWFAIGNT